MLFAAAGRNPLVGLAAAFAGDDDLVRRAERLAAEAGIDEAVVGNAEFDVLGNEGIEDRIRNLVGEFVRVAFGYGFGGKEKIACFRHNHALYWQKAKMVKEVRCTPYRDL